MRHQWRLLLLRNYHHLSHLQHQSPRSHLQVPLRSLSTSFLSPHRHHYRHQKALAFRSFSVAVAEKDPDHVAVVTDVFSKLTDKDEIRRDLESNGVVISHDLGLKVLRGLESRPDVARRFFEWVLEKESERLSSKSYNLMLGILGGNGCVDEFWGLVDAMKKKGYGVSGRVRDKVSETFEKDGLEGDLERLRGVFATGSMDNTVEKVCSRVCKIVRKEEWSADVEKQLKGLKVEFSSDLVKLVLENLDMDPRKALLFFRWVEEAGLFKHDERTYNAVAKVLGRDKFLDRFWNAIKEMRSAGFEMELEAYVKVSARFCHTKMIKEAVELYEFAMAGANSPTPHCCTLLLKKIVMAKKLDMDLFTRVVKVYTGNGNLLTDSMLESVLKSLRSVDRFGECNEVLKAMEKGGFVAGGDLQSKIALGLSRAGKKDEASEFESFMESSGNNLDDKALAALVEGHCAAGELEKASDSFKKMLGKGGLSYASYAFEKLVLAYCNKNQVRDAYKLLFKYVNENQLEPWHSTYKLLVRNLLTNKVSIQGGFNDALSLLPLMKNHGLPPFVDPFLDYLSKSGTGDDALAFLKAMTSKKFPSISMVLRVFTAMLKAARHNEAQGLLSKCPGYIRSHPDVLELFHSMKSGSEDSPETAVAA